MIIGVDCDGVLTDMSAYIFHYGEKLFKKKPENPDAFYPGEIFNYGKLHDAFFWLRYFFPYCKKCPPRKYAAAAIRKLMNDGHEIYQITARKFASRENFLGRYSRNLYKQWLKKHGFKFSGIYFCSDSKGPSDKMKGIRSVSADVMIDDRPDIALYLAKRNVRVMLFDNRYNKGVCHKNIIRVYDWKDAYRKLTVLADKI